MRFEVCDDWGVHIYEVEKVVPGIVYFKNKTWDDHRLRYNVLEARLEECLPGGEWDVFVSDIFQAGFVEG